MPPYTARVVSDQELADIYAFLVSIPQPPAAKSILILNNGAITFYLDHKVEIDEYLTRAEREFEEGAIPLQQADPTLWEKLERASSKMGERGG